MCTMDNWLECGSLIGIETPDVSDMIAGGIADSLDDLLQEATDAMNQVSGMLMTWWMGTPSPDVSNCGLDGVSRTTGASTVSPECGQPTGAIESVADHTLWIVGFVAVLSLVIAAIKIAISRDGKAARDVVGGLIGLLVGSTIVLGALQITITVGDAYSKWIITEASGGEDPSTFFLSSLNAADNTLATLLMLGVVSPAMLLGVIQFVLLLARFAGLIFLSGLAPVAFAVGMTGGGRAMRDKYLAWMIAFALYKPVAATIWATVIWMIRESVFNMGALQAFIHLLVLNMMMLMALFALPAMMRLIAPAVSTVGGGGGGGLFAAVAGGASIASGAVDVNSRHRSTQTSTARSGPRPEASGANGAQTTPKPTTVGGGQHAGNAAKNAGNAAKGAKMAGSAGVAAGTGGASLAVQGSVEAVKIAGKIAQGVGEHAAGDTPTGAQGGAK